MGVQMVSFRKSLAVALLTMVSSTAMAQDLSSGVAAEREAAADGDSIIVTGTRIKQDGFAEAAPTIVIDQAEMETSGFTDLGQILADQPGIELTDTTVGSPNGTIQNTGTVSIDLRDMGSARTLTLINGRRAVSNAANRNVVSLNTIPIDFVERVEVITGAASAIYGSDAIAGVVNIITESNLQGVRLRGRLGSALTSGGGAEELTISGTFGTKFSEGRGYFTVSASLDKDFGLFARDRRDRATRSWSFSPTTNTISEPGFSTDIQGGRFRGGPFWYDESGLRTDFVTAQHGYNDRELDVLRIPRTTKAIAGKLKYEVAKAFVPYAEVQFSRLETEWSRAPLGWRDDSTVFLRDDTGLPLPGLPTFTVGRIHRDSAYVPSEIRFGVPALGLGAAPSSGVSWRRRFDEVGNREFENRRDTLRIWAGATGDIGGGWSYEVGYSFGEFTQHQERRNNLNLTNMKFALDAVNVGGVIQCRDAAARAAGCVPLNLFGVGSITPEAADYIRHNSIFNARLQQNDILAYATGPLFRLPAGNVSLAVGVEYRDEFIAAGSDDATLANVTTTSQIPTFTGSFNVKEAFAELSVPVLRDAPFFKSLSFDVAARLADYSQKNVDTVLSYQAGLNWQPVEDLRLRARYGVAQRAPNLTELYSPPRDDTDTIVDICSGVTATTAGTVALNCRSVPGIAAAIAAAGVFTQSTTNIQSPNTGNLGLKEETSRSLTLGAVLTPSALPGFNISFDYYRIRVKDVIAPFDNDVLLRECYTDASTFASNPFCTSVLRDGGSGQIQQIIQVPQNLDKMTVSGFDLAARYRIDLAGLGVAGRLNLRVNWTHVLERETEFQGLNGPQTTSNVGTIANPKDQVRARIEYSNRLWEAGWRVRYIGPVVSSHDRVADAIAAGFQNPLYLNYSAYWRHDVSATLKPRFGGMRWDLTAGINNLFNKTGPDVPEGATPNDANGFISRYGVVGRTGYASIRVRF